ncbi:class I SAM-dependent methyltransferase [Phenylobacterium sp.]|uniref:class I SAM-dependent methyltransferase n=1 Tax=Phenylobacterium sp. TaxID=1871053 RepID=UPI002DEF35BB|nr:class I SAM-dependent methyltransferase [Phenylobacterium sp.]
MAAVRPYYSAGSMSAAFYDVVTAADARLAGDVEVYAGLAPAGGSVLELGAGSGRITAELAQRGFEVTGVDLSRTMLEQAERRRAALAPEVAARIALKLGDMTALDLKRGFDLVICPYFTLAHVPAGQAWKNSFRTAARHLAPGGLAAFHLPRLSLMSQVSPPDPGAVVLDEPLPGGGRLRLRVLQRGFRQPVGRLEQVIEYEELDARGQSLRRSAERLAYYMADPVPLAQAAGLTPDREPAVLGDVGDIWVFRGS